MRTSVPDREQPLEHLGNQRRKGIRFQRSPFSAVGGARVEPVFQPVTHTRKSPSHNWDMDAFDSGRGPVADRSTRSKRRVGSIGRGIGGTTHNDAGMGIAGDGDGNSYVTGALMDTATFGSLTLTRPGPGAVDVFVAGYDTSANVVRRDRSLGLQCSDDIACRCEAI